MSVELRPLGVACNLSCRYCYQNPERTAGNRRPAYDLEKMKAETLRVGGPFTLFGGEPLLMPFKDLEHLFAWGLEKFGGSAIQTNGLLIEDRHLEAFRRYKVSVGISIDGPGELNDARWHQGLEKTRQSTATIEAAIGRLCREYQPPGLIVTLHQGNATADKLPVMAEWMRKLHTLGIRSVRLHLLEVDQASVRTSLALSPRQNIEAIMALAHAQEELPGMRMDLFTDMERLLRGDDTKVGCIWRACDPYRTDAVRGIEGNGQSSNCGRTNKEGVGFIKAGSAGFERYLALYRTPQSNNGCAGCRFFLMCKGQCPGTAMGGDWRNRTEHCEVWKHLFSVLERRMILAGGSPLTLQPVRLELERRQIEAWERGRNPSLSQLRAALGKEQVAAAGAGAAPVNAEASHPAQASPARTPRVSWVSAAAQAEWHPRLARLRSVLEDLVVYAAAGSSGERCEARRVPATSFPRLRDLAAAKAVGSATLPPEALPTGICAVLPQDQTGVFLAGRPEVVARAEAAWGAGSLAAFHALLNLPACCVRHGAETSHPGMLPAGSGTTHLPVTLWPHPLLAVLGLAATAILPCRLDCRTAIETAQPRFEEMAAHGFMQEAEWLKECLLWAVSHTELHGIGEVKTPLFKACYQTPFDLGARVILRPGSADMKDAARGHSFPYAAPTRPWLQRGEKAL